MRVMYEDPGQKVKLIELLESQTPGEGHSSVGKKVIKKGVSGVRRSTRTAAYYVLLHISGGRQLI